MKKRVLAVLLALGLLLLLFGFINACGFAAHECCINCPICSFTKEIGRLLLLILLFVFFIFDANETGSDKIGYNKEHPATLLPCTPIKLKVKLSD